MPHPSEEQLLAFADDELEARDRREVAAHVRECALCRHALRDLQGAVEALSVELALVDASEPSEWRSNVTRRAPRQASQRHAESRRPLRPAAPPISRAPVRWAAAFLLLVAGGAAAMTAPRWRTLLATAPAPVATVAASRVPVTPVANAIRTAAVSVVPSRDEATVSLMSGADAGDARVFVDVSDRRDVQVTVETPAATDGVPRFISSGDRLEVQLTGAGAVVHVEAPASLHALRITHLGRTIVSIEDGVVHPIQATNSGVRLSPPEGLQ